MKLVRSCIIAFAMYSKIPVPKTEWNEESMKYTLCFFPLIGIVEGLLFTALWYYLSLCKFDRMFINAVLTVTPVLITGGIHVDGFLDTMDAISSWQEKEKKLEILKDPHTGAFAIISGIVYFILYFGGISQIQTIESAILTAAGFVISRILSAGALVTLKNAKKEGLCYTFSSAAHKRTVRIVLVFELIITVAILCTFLKNGWIVPLIAGLTWFYYYKMSYRQFGGITGDLAGFFLQLCELFTLYGVGIISVMNR